MPQQPALGRKRKQSRLRALQEQLEEGIERFLRREARDDEERKAWLRALPFVD